MAYTKRKWKVVDKTTLQGNYMIMPKGSGGVIARVYNEANAECIVACVNGCKDINPEAVKDMYEALKDAQHWFAMAAAYIPLHSLTLGTINQALLKAEESNG